MRDGFIIHEKTLQQAQMLSLKQAGQLLMAMIAHHRGVDLPGDIEQIVAVLMIDIAERMDADAEAYEKSAAQRKEAAAKRWENANAMRKDATALRTPCEGDAKNAVSVSVSVSDSVKNIKKQKGAFKPPTREEVEAYCKERGNHIDPDAFVDFYASKGWKVGSQPMKYWKACVRTWEKRDAERRPAAKKAYQIESHERTAADWSELERKLLTGG